MKKVVMIIVISIIAVAIGFIIGIGILKPKSNDNRVIAKDETDVIKLENVNTVQLREIQTSALEEKISVNTIITKITYYKDCNHQIENKTKDISKYVNMTKEKFQKEFPDWEIKEFNKDNVVLYKEEEDFCNEHFLVKNEDGFVTIYTIDNQERILELLNKTEIATNYLTKVDQDNLNKGMIIYTKENLNKLIEDFE